MTIELPKRIAENIDRFTGRTWLLPRLLDWWDKSDDQLFLLTGGPGTGKSTIIAWLTGFGPVPYEPTAESQLSQIRSAVKATHFCQSTSLNTPRLLAESVANQLANKVDGYREALKTILEDRVRIEGTVKAKAAAAGSTLIGVDVKLNLAALGDEFGFDHAFIRPLRKLYEDGYAEKMLLLVDSLDEAQIYTGTTIPELLSRPSDLPPQVRILATTRDEPRVLKFFHMIKPFDLIKDADPDVDDVRTYTEARLTRLAAIEESKRNNFSSRLAQKAGGVFLYAAMVIDDLLGSPPAELPELDTYPMPEGLSGIYQSFLNRELGKADKCWFDFYESLLGLIAVAHGDGLTAQQLTEIIGKDIRGALRACKQYLSGELPDGPFRIFHKSFTDFLLEDENNVDYHIDAQAMHKRIADHYWAYKLDWSKCDEYGLTYLARHLNEAACAEQLFQLAGNHLWMTEKQLRLRDPLLLLDDLSLTMKVARQRQPPETDVLVRSSAASSHLIGAAPPLVVDALARAGWLRRAQLLADNSAFPLDRCRALSWLAQRWDEQGETALALDSLNAAVDASERVTASFHAMAISFCVEAACAVGSGVRAEKLAREALRSARERLLLGIDSGGGKMRELEHLLFWTACAARAALGERGVTEVRALMPKNRFPFNLDLQIAAVIGDAALLGEIWHERQEKEWHPSVPGNLALALADVGLTSAARMLINLDTDKDFADNTKRMAWAAAICGDWDRAFALAEKIRHPEEAVRALHRIQRIAHAQKVKSGVRRAADLAEETLRGLPSEASSLPQRPDSGKVTGRMRMGKKAVSREDWDPNERWRVAAWVTNALAVAGDFERATQLAEEICHRNVPSIEANSLCYPTSYSSKRRQHVVPQDPIEVEAFSRELLKVRNRKGLSAIAQICDRLERQTGRHTWGEMTKALIAITDSNAFKARIGWLEALMAAARLGRSEVGAVVGIHRLVSWRDWRPMTKSQLLRALDEGDLSITATHH